ncbi:uncharacterized protein [Diadema antillarum]|uniref:uncharacterized protein n=1 Tax=Diadema antillarum TaxID=105358 RepID=UPI003A84AB5C
MSGQTRKSSSKELHCDTLQDVSREVNTVLQSVSRLKRRHFAAIVSVLDRCESGLQQLKPANDGNAKRKSRTSRSPWANKKSPESWPDTCTPEFQQHPDPDKLALAIKDHFIKMVAELSAYLHQATDPDKSELIWVSYESKFFRAVRSEITELYVFAYEGDAKLLQMLLPSANPRNMKLRGEWLVDILDPCQNDAEPEAMSDPPGQLASTPPVRKTAEISVQTDPTSSDDNDENEEEASPIAVFSLDRLNPETCGQIVEREPGNRKAPHRTSQAASTGSVDSNHISKQSSVLTEEKRKTTHQRERRSYEPEFASKDDGLLPLFSSSLIEELDHFCPTSSQDSLHESSNDQPRKPVNRLLTRKRSDEHPLQASKKNDADLTEEKVSFRVLFSHAYYYFEMALQEGFPIAKLRLLVKCVREISDTVKRRLSESWEKKVIGSDELLPSVILFLIKGDPGKTTSFYPHLKFLIDYLPDFLATGEVGFTLMQFNVAYSYILQNDGSDS